MPPLPLPSVHFTSDGWMDGSFVAPDECTGVRKRMPEVTFYNPTAGKIISIFLDVLWGEGFTQCSKTA